MSALGRITNSLLSGTNENNLSLATLNFDFSLIQIEAPKEFKSLASALSTHRRHDAEEGQPHRTARKLGALFEDLIPSAPKLIEAFGKRVSQIVQTPGINPRGAPIHGPFEQFVGADGTTLWAAATSGIPAIGVYLLSCLLARAWDAKEATALWVELVKQRQKEIQDAYEQNHIVSASAMFVARQEISREDLARWDKSARSWLRSADRAKVAQHDQLKVIIRSLPLPLTAASCTYASVISVWREAMLGMDGLLSGNPVLITNGSLFLAFSSWYLFPNLIVLGNKTTHVEFNDDLFPPGGSCTVGREIITDQSGGIRWSLALSHLRYYGDPVVVRSNVDSSRVTFQELKLTFLGYIFKQWRVSDRDQSLVAQWLLDLWTVIQEIPEADNESRPRFGWLKILVDAAAEFLNPEPRTRQKNTQLVRFGRRRGDLFSVAIFETMLPFFGICHPLRLAALSQKNDLEGGISFLRTMAQSLELDEEKAIICHALDGHLHDRSESAKSFQVVTAVPHIYQTNKRDSEGLPVCQRIHARWSISRVESGTGTQDANNMLPIYNYTQQGEICSSIQTEAMVYDEFKSTFTWPVIPNLYQKGRCQGSTKPSNRSSVCTCFEWGSKDNEGSSANFRQIYGDWRLGLYVQKRGSPSETEEKVHDLQQCAHSLAKEHGSISTGIQSFANTQITPSLISDYLSVITRGADGDGDGDYAHEVRERDLRVSQNVPGMSIVGNPSLPNGFCRTLFAHEIASRVYAGLEGATISLSVLSQPFCDCAWVPDRICEPLEFNPQPQPASPATPQIQRPPTPVSLTRQQTFACVAYFESGHIDLDPADLHSVLALCSEDSIFVAATFLLDPFEQPAPHELRRIVGNISHPGLSLLVAPEGPRIRNPTNKYNAVTHASYDFKRENNFRGTSLHLSFTDWRFPLEAGEYRTIDQDVSVVEAVISVLDGGRWVADLDILCIDFEGLTRIVRECAVHGREEHDLEYDYTSIDSWDELLDGPEGVGIFRAHGNWAARLAAVSILSQQGNGHSIAVFGMRNICFKCLEAEVEGVGLNLTDHESPLPSFCVD